MVWKGEMRRATDNGKPDLAILVPESHTGVKWLKSSLLDEIKHRDGKRGRKSPENKHTISCQSEDVKTQSKKNSTMNDVMR